MRVVLGSKGIFPFYSFLLLSTPSTLPTPSLSCFASLRMTPITSWVTFCNPQTVGRVVGGMGMGYIFVTRKQMGWVVGRGGVGYIFVTRNETCVAVVVGNGIYGLHKWEK